MEQYSHTADYVYIEVALKSQWNSFEAIGLEMKAFEPKVLADFAEHRLSELTRLHALNPGSSDEELLVIVDGQIRARVDSSFQFNRQFSDRVMALYVTVAFLSHALSEAAINAILAIGLATKGAADLFQMLERADIKEKWVTGPKAIYPAYELARSGALFQTLQHLTRQRNAFIHYKVELEVAGKKVLSGSNIDRPSLQSCMSWMERYFSLPYDLCDNLRLRTQGHAGAVLIDRGPLRAFQAHLESRNI